jgi:hypothetical protein
MPERYRPSEIFKRTVASMTDEECAACLPRLRKWLADAQGALPIMGRQTALSWLPTKEQPLRRVVDKTHHELMRCVVDEHNVVRFVRTVDAVRTPLKLQWPQAIGANLFDTIPAAVVPKWQDMVLKTRWTQQAHTWQADSVLIPGEVRVTHTYPARLPDWIAVSVVMVEAAVEKSLVILPAALLTVL